MSLPRRLHLQITPDLNRPLSYTKIADYWRLFRWLIWFPQALHGWIRLHPQMQGASTLLIMVAVLTACLSWLVGGGLWLWMHFSFSTQVSSFEQFVLVCIAVFASWLITAGLLLLGASFHKPSILMAAFAGSPLLVTFILLLLLQLMVAVTSLLDVGLAQALLGGCAGLLYSTVAAFRNRGLPYIRLIFWLGTIGCVLLLLTQIPGILHTQPVPADLQSAAFRLLTATIGCCLGFFVVALRVEEWLYATLYLGLTRKQAPITHLGKVTVLPLPGLSDALAKSAAEDWEQGLDAAADIWNFTRQRRIVVQVFYAALLEKRNTPCLALQVKALVERNDVSWQPHSFFDGGARSSRQLLRQLWTHSEPKALLTYSDANTVNAQLASEEYCIEEFYKEAREQLMMVVDTSKAPDEVTQLTSAIDRFLSIRRPLASIELPATNADDAQRQNGIWPALTQLMEILIYCWLARRCQSSQNQATALQTARDKLDELERWIVRTTTLSTCENKVLSRIVENWRQDLQSGQMLEILKFQGCPHMRDEPFIYNEPLWLPELMRDCDKARETLVKALNCEHMQVCEISGPILCGKTSLLRATTTTSKLIGASELITVDLKFLNTQAPALKRVALSLYDRLSVRHRSTFWTEEKLLSDPLRVLEQMISEICLADTKKKLIIALDSVENIDHVLTLQYDLHKFLHFLFYLCESIPNLGIVLICTPDHGHNYENFRSSITRLANPSTVTFFDPVNNTVIAEFLQHPVHGFCHRFTQRAVEHVARLTGGQPYLVQLLAAGVLEQFRVNYQYLAGGALPAGQSHFYDPLFNELDVEEAGGTGFVLQGLRYYWHRLEQHFAGDWPNTYLILRQYRSDWDAALQPAVVATQFSSSQPPVNTSYVADLMERLVKQGILDSDNTGRYTLRVKMLNHLI